MINSHAQTAGRKILGSKLRDTGSKIDIPRFAELYREGKFNMDEITGKPGTINDGNEVIAASDVDEALFNVIVPD